jgi:hypothetical protein
MFAVQRYVSKELMHFVGRGKEEDEQYDILVNKIIKPGMLMHPPHDPTEKSGYEIRFESLISENELCNPRMICFCDIPEDDLSLHMGKYSRFGLSFLKSFLIPKGANPVHYIAHNSTVENLFCGKLKRAVFYDQRLKEYIRALHNLFNEFLPKDRNGKMPASITTENAPLSMYFQTLSNFIEVEVLSFVKFFDDTKKEDDPENYYMEREWRMLTHLSFSIDDVYRVILPSIYVDRFRNDVPEFNGNLNIAD